MSLPILFPKLYIRLTIEGRTEERSITDVKSWARGERLIVSGTYRDSGWAPGKGLVYPTGMTGTANVATEMPLVGDETQTPSASAWDGLKWATPDEMAHIAPRPRIQRASGIFIGVTDDALPDPVNIEPAYGSATFTVNTTTKICSTGTPHPFHHGDLVTVAFTTAPTPVAAATLYYIVKIDATSFMLRTAAGALVNFSGAGANNVAILVRSAYTPLPPMEPGVFFYRDEWKPRLYTDAAMTDNLLL